MNTTKNCAMNLREDSSHEKPIEGNTSSFYSLSPTSQIENGESYFEALNWALNNRKEKDIKNIALTGPYGSGKSSVIQSFQKINKNKDLHFLNISLATFKEETKEKDAENKTRDENLQRLIELSILQQLFYRESDDKLPDSHLKKIKSLSCKLLLGITISCILFILSLFYLIDSQLIAGIFRSQNVANNILFHYFSLVFFIAGFGYAIFKFIRILHNLKVNKLKVADAEIQIAPEINKSVLNHNLIEILYFFEVTNYNVVVFEDLDRFEQIDIFTNLRELNLLINNAKKINRDIVFVYVVRDDMFIDRDRTKFFDFIIPIIPVINSSNSNEFLQKGIKPIVNNISESLIDDISLFIDEMRLLYNIINEFQIYKKMLSKNLSQDKLLAMIVYKNINPNDFVNLSSHKGELYDNINKKRDYIKQESDNIDEKISKNKEKIQTLEALKIKDKKELRSLYILQYIIALGNNISGFIINNKNYNITSVLEEDVFSYFVENNAYYRPNNQQQRSLKISNQFSDIEKQVGQYTYKERELQIEDWNNGKVQTLRQENISLERKKDELRHKRISELLFDKKIHISENDNKQKLIFLLLRHGYIDENYIDYISLFHEGTLSINDHTFLLNVKSQIGSDFAHQLNNIDKLISKIHIDDFKREYILNYSLFDFILTSNEYELQKKAIFNLLKNEDSNMIKFIDGFIDNGINIGLFVKELYRNQINVYDLMCKNTITISEEKLRGYFKLVIAHADINDIKSTEKPSSLLLAISDNPENNYDIFDLSLDEKRIIEIIKAFDIKFKYRLNTSVISKEMMDYIYQNNHYQININLIKTMLQAKTNFNMIDFDTKNYFAIKNSSCETLIKYIDDNIEDYIVNVYQMIETNTKENEDSLILLLNNEDLTLKSKRAIIQKVETKISDLKKINSIELNNILLQSSKAEASWKNLIGNYDNNSQEMQEHIITFFNTAENAKILSQEKIDVDYPNNDTVKKFLKAVLLNDKINADSYRLIIRPIPYSYTSLELENLSYEKLELLVENDRLGLSEENFSSLKGKRNLHIRLIEKRKHELFEKIAELTLDDNDVIKLLRSSFFTLEEKQKVINAYGENTIKSTAILESIGELIMSDNFYIFDINILKSIFNNIDKSTDYKIELFIKINQILNKDSITSILSSFPEPYSDITKIDNVIIQENTINRNFAETLRSKQYIKNFRATNKGIKIIK